MVSIQLFLIPNFFILLIFFQMATRDFMNNIIIVLFGQKFFFYSFLNLLIICWSKNPLVPSSSSELNHKNL